MVAGDMGTDAGYLVMTKEDRYAADAECKAFVILEDEAYVWPVHQREAAVVWSKKIGGLLVWRGEKGSVVL